MDLNMITIIERDLLPEEYEQITSGFDTHAIENHIEIQSAERIGYVALKDNNFIGSATGLAYKNGDVYNGWFQLTDLFVEKDHRFHGIGRALLEKLENKLIGLGICKIWTWTARYEGMDFYKKQDYRKFAVQENWYSNGNARIGLIKTLYKNS